LSAFGWSGYVIVRYLVHREIRRVGEFLKWELTRTRRSSGRVVIAFILVLFVAVAGTR
jgi:hypothetical protein